MKKSRYLAALLCSTLVMGGASLPVMADGTKVVTLGADLTDAQRQTMMNYFRANPNEVQILYVTNQDERNHLGAYVPLEQIGTRTLSCAYVKPTTSGGIRVRTANLNYVTGNMIASTLTTSGVANCEVIAACPFEVSGTGALTGIQMAYERATGAQLDTAKKDLAAQEIVVTGNVATQVGNNEATRLINSAKMEVIQNNVQNTEEIYNIVNNICVENNINITQNNVVQVVDLLTEISKQEYDYDEIAPTLENVDENVGMVKTKSEGSEEDVEQAAAVLEQDYDEDSILTEIDESALGEDVPTSSTDDPALEYETYDSAAEFGEQAFVKQGGETSETSEEDGGYSEFGIPEAVETVVVPEGDGTEEEAGDQQWEETQFSGEEAPEEGTAAYEEGTSDEGKETSDQWEDTTNEWEKASVDGEAVSGDGAEASGQDSMTEEEREAKKSALDAQDLSQYNAVLDFCRQEFENGTGAPTGTVIPSYVITDPALAMKVSLAVSDKYLEILAEDAASSMTGTDNAYVPDGTEKYVSTDLNRADRFLRELFGTDPLTSAAPDDILKDLSYENRKLLYDDCIRFFEQLYGESSAAAPAGTEQQAPVQETAPDAEQNSNAGWIPAAQYSGQEQEYSSNETYGGYEEGGYSEESYDYSGYAEDDSYGIPEGTEEYY